MRVSRILSLFFSPQTKEALKREWVASQQKELDSAFEAQKLELKSKHSSLLAEIEKVSQSSLDEVKASLEIKTQQAKLASQDLDDLIVRLQDRKEELARASKELKDQLRLIEAKASPSNIWAEAFTCGFEKAWDMMIPVMTGGVENLKKLIHDRAVDQTLSNLDLHIRERASKLNGNSIH